MDELPFGLFSRLEGRVFDGGESSIKKSPREMLYEAELSTVEQYWSECHSVEPQPLQFRSVFDSPVSIFETDVLKDPFAAQRTPSRIKKVALKGMTLDVTTPNSVLIPRPETIVDPATHMPRSFIKVQRLEDGRASLRCPKKWQHLGWVIYMFVTSDSRVLIGRTKNIYDRLQNYQAALNGYGDASKRSLPSAWRNGQDVYVGILHVCSSERSMIQNETSFIVAQKSKHNKNKGNGDPTLIFGSPLLDGRGGLLPEVEEEPDRSYRDLPVLKDPFGPSPTKYVEVQYNEEEDEYSIDLPKEWQNQTNVIYQFKDENGLKLVGSTGRPLKKRVSEYIKSFNGDGENSQFALPKAVKKGLKVFFTVIGTGGPEWLLQWEGEIMRQKGTFQPQGFNRRQEGIPGLIPPSPLHIIGASSSSEAAPSRPPSPVDPFQTPFRSKKKASRPGLGGAGSVRRSLVF